MPPLSFSIFLRPKRSIHHPKCQRIHALPFKNKGRWSGREIWQTISFQVGYCGGIGRPICGFIYTAAKKKKKNTAATLFCFWSLKREQLQKLRRAECLDPSTDTLTHALSSTLWTCLIVSWELIWYTYEYH